MINNKQVCIESLNYLNKLYSECDEILDRINNVTTSIDLTKTSNRVENIILPVIYGVISCSVSASDNVNNFLRKFHDEYPSDNNFLGRILKHKGDWIDRTDNVFRTRYGDTVSGPFHRFLWGHDIFSLSKDNPFYLSIKQYSPQYGVITSIAMALRHLIVDCFSKQGLPIPFSSWFDSQEGDNDRFLKCGKNKLFDFAQNLSEEVFGKSNAVNTSKILNNMFTIKASDIIATGASSVFCRIHNYLLNKDDLTEASQVRLIAYATQFFGKIIYGMIKTNGIPFISWPSLIATLKEIYIFTKQTYKDVDDLNKITYDIHSSVCDIEREILHNGENIIGYDNIYYYIEEKNKIKNNIISIFKNQNKQIES